MKLTPPPTPTKKKPFDHTTAYANAVVSGKQPANLYVRLACQRHLDDLKRDDVWFDVHAADRFFRYCPRFLKHYKGPMAGQPVILDPWELFCFGCIYGWKQIEDGKFTNYWRFNIIYLEVPRKNGKTTIAAAGASYDCGFVEKTGAEVYCLATKEDQAKLLFNDVSAYIEQSEELNETFQLLTGKSIIYATDTRTNFIRPLGSDSKRQDGLNPLAAYCDELHAWPNPDLWNVIKNAFGARKSWHMVAITTAGNNREGICYQQRSQIVNILEGRIKNDQMFGIIYTVDDDQQENWRDEKNWYIANPSLGHGKFLKYMKDECLTAEQMPSQLNGFLNKQLNIWTDVAEAWLSTTQWAGCKLVYTLETLKFKKCTAAFDLARVSDLSAVAYVFGKQPGLDRIHVFVHFYIPRFQLRERSERDGVDYGIWEKDGHITITPGKTTDYEFIRKDINKTASIVKVEKVMYDRHFSGELVTNLTNDGFKLEEIGMGFISMGAPTAELERLIVESQLYHPNNPILNWNAANVVIVRDAAGNIKPDKDLSNKRIDGIVAVIMALADVCKYTKTVSKYEKEGILTIGGQKSKDDSR